MSLLIIEAASKKMRRKLEISVERVAIRSHAFDTCLTEGRCRQCKATDGNFLAHSKW